MECITYASHSGRTTIVGQHQAQGPQTNRKLSSRVVPTHYLSHTAMEIIIPLEPRKNSLVLRTPAGSVGQILDTEEAAPADEFDVNETSLITRGQDECGEPDEEEKSQSEKEIKPKESFIKCAADNRFKQGSNSQLATKIMESVTQSNIQFEKPGKIKKGKKQGSVKNSKSPDPFEAQHDESEKKLLSLITNTTNPDNPLHNLRKSGIHSTASLRAYKHYIISLFESACFIREMTPIEDYQIRLQRQFLLRPTNIPCNVIENYPFSK